MSELRYLLDTSAFFTLRYDEKGAEQVQDILKNGQKSCLVSFMTFMEYFYNIWRKEGESTAMEAYLQLKNLPVKKIETSESLLLLAAEIKATCSLSLADSWIAATAIQEKAVLVHKDPEFEQLKDRLSLKPLPYK
jgi:predicted nucleic acid-binding protein